MVNVGMNFLNLKLRFLIAIFSFCSTTETFTIVIRNLVEHKWVDFGIFRWNMPHFVVIQKFLDWNLQELLNYVSVLITTNFFNSKCD